MVKSDSERAIADYNKPKSEAGERAIPLGPMVVNTLKEWKLACPKGELDLVFPNTLGNIWDHADIVSRYLCPTMVAAGVIDAVGEAKYTGLHALRHFYASWLINRKRDGGLELPVKTVQARMGHSSIVMTMDTYGHLSPAAMTETKWRTPKRHCWRECDTDATYRRIGE